MDDTEKTGRAGGFQRPDCDNLGRAMPKSLDCPNCGAPLAFDGGAAVVKCCYCKRHIVVEDRSLTQEPAGEEARAPSDPPPRPAAARARGKGASRKHAPGAGGRSGPWTKPQRIVIIAVTSVMAVAGMGITWAVRHGPRRAAQVSGEEPLRRLDLSASPDQVRALFGAAIHPSSTPNRVTVDYQLGQGKVRRIELARDLPDKNHISGVTLGGNFDQKAAVARIEQLAANRVREQGPITHRVHVGDAVLDVSGTTVKVWHWSSVHAANADYAHCQARLGALWALARWATLDGPALTPEQQKLVTGPTLEETASIDTSTTVEQAADAFQKKFSSGWCRMQAGLTCVVDVDHALVDEVHWQWPNGLRARMQYAQFMFKPRRDAEKAQRALAGCLQPVLGAGEETVVDYVKGTRSWSWKVGDGGRVVLGTRELDLTPAEKAAADQPAPWVSKFAAIVSAVDRCRL
jgi:hypothetical protein